MDEILIFSLVLTLLNIVYSICYAYAKSTNDARGTEEPPKAATESERSLTLLTQNLLELQKEMIKT